MKVASASRGLGRVCVVARVPSGQICFRFEKGSLTWLDDMEILEFSSGNWRPGYSAGGVCEVFSLAGYVPFHCLDSSLMKKGILCLALYGDGIDCRPLVTYLSKYENHHIHLMALSQQKGGITHHIPGPLPPMPLPISFTLVPLTL